jgi:hypothetical protein
MAEWGWKARCQKPQASYFVHFSNHKQKILKGPLAFQPNTGSCLKKLETVRLQGRTPVLREVGQSLGAMLGWERTSDLEAFSAFAERGHLRPAKGRDEAL